jgi:hypothetical protein
MRSANAVLRTTTSDGSVDFLYEPRHHDAVFGLLVLYGMNIFLPRSLVDLDQTTLEI